MSKQVKGLRRIGEGDQADIFTITQKRQNTGAHLKVDEKQIIGKERT